MLLPMLTRYAFQRLKTSLSMSHILCTALKQVLENWYPTVEEGDKKAVLLVVTSSKDGALTGGPGFMAVCFESATPAVLSSVLTARSCQAIGDELIDSIVSDQIPILTEQERYNETVASTVDRIDAKLNGNVVPGKGPLVTFLSLVV
jgi:uncharacterized protein